MSLIHRGVKVLLRCCWNNNNNNKKKSFRPKYKQIICQNVSGNNNQRVSLMLIHLYILSLTKKKIIMNITKLGVFSFCPLVDFTVEMIQISSDLVKECTRSE